MAKKKLLHIVEAMGGGIFTYLVDLANCLVNDYDVYIAYAVRTQTPENVSDYFDDRVSLIIMKKLTRELSPKKDLSAFYEIRSLVATIQPDIVHLHSSKAGVLGRWALNGKRMPLFYTPHGYSFLMEDCSSLKRFFYKSIEKICARRRCTTISCSAGENKETLKLTTNALYINNGICVEKLEQALKNVMPVEQDLFTVCTLGRICYQKNPTLFSSIAEQMPDVKFIWIGDGEMRDALSAPNIEITGWVEREKALALAMSADAFLLTSRWEGLPISLLEAMYLKKVCVVSDVIGNHDVISNGNNGFVCQTVEDYVTALNDIRFNNNCSDIVENAYNDILEQYNTVVMAKQYDSVYQQALEKYARNA